MSWFDKDTEGGMEVEDGTGTDDSSLLEHLKMLYCHARDFTHDWRQEARQSYDFVAGKQYTDEDMALLQIQNRPAIVFNRVLPLVDAVCGLEVNNRQEVCYYPRTMGDVTANDILTNAAKWVRDECEGAEEESDAFRDMVITGIGCTETRLDYEQEPDGKIIIERVDPMEMYWDSSARKKNLSDARCIFRVRDVNREQAEIMFPEAKGEELHAWWADDTGASQSPHDATEAPYYRNDQSGRIDKTADKVRIVEAQWYDTKRGWLVIDPVTGAKQEMSEDEYKRMQERVLLLNLPEPVAVRREMRHYKKAFIGGKILKMVDGPEKGGFTYKFMTGKRDRNKGLFFGIMRSVRDPQMWGNKWMSQILHILNTNAKGGIMAEEDAFVDVQEAVDSWAQADSVTLFNNGALAAGKVQPKPQVQFPSGFDTMMQFAINSIQSCSGINLELLGQVDRNQPGILEHQRKQSAITILAELFDSLRRYRKDQGKLMLYYILNFISDGRLIRINGDEMAQYVPLVHQPGLVEYDVIIDDAPDTVNLKERAWVAIQQMLPVIGKMLTPEMWLSVLKYSPMPTPFVIEMTKAAKEQQAKPPQPNPDMVKAQADMTRAQATMVESQAKARHYDSLAQTEGTKAQWHSVQAQNYIADQHLQEQKALMEKDKTASDVYLNYVRAQQITNQDMANQAHTTIDLLRKLGNNESINESTNQPSNQSENQFTGGV